MNKSIIFSAVQPSGILTIGNYIGSLRQWVSLQDKNKCIYCIVDLHAITKQQTPLKLNKTTLDILALYLACGVNPNKSTIFIQSHVPYHSQLCWLLSCYTYFGELNRMVQFKNKLYSFNKNINSGLFYYPVLMASDILLYQTNKVPVGDDQKQHVELSRDIAKRFNSIYNNTFTVPKALLVKSGSRIMSLRNPFKKMSKSDSNKNNVIFLLENIQSLIHKIKSAVTDSDKSSSIIYNPKLKPGISNLLNIISGLTELSIDNLENYFINKTYNYLKNFVIDTIINFIIPLQNRYYMFRNNEDYLNQIIVNGAKKANIYASITLNDIYKKIGLLI